MPAPSGRIIRLASLTVAVLTAAVACSTAGESSETSTTAVGSSTTSTVPSTTTVPDTTLPPGTGEPSQRGIRADTSLGDSLFPELGNGGYDATAYDVDLRWSDPPGHLDGEVTMTATATADLDTFSLDFAGPDVDSVSVNGTPAEWRREARELIVDPPVVVAADSGFTVTVSYAGLVQPFAASALPFPIGWLTARNGTVFVASEPDGTRSWMPVNDHPLDKADTYRFRITVPEGWTAAANGRLVEEVSGEGTTTWVWQSDDPLASYLVTLVIGEDLTIVEGLDAGTVDVRHVLPPDLVEDPPAALALTDEIIESLETLFGPFPMGEFGITVVDADFPAIETQTLSVFGRQFALHPRFETVLVHEIAHHWFGNSVSPGRWGDIWLNEGFATYSEWLWDEMTGGDASGLGIGQAGIQTAVGLLADQVRETGMPPPGTPTANDLFPEEVYVRGALTLHAVRLEIGDEAFFRLLRTWAERFRYSTATTEDFLAVTAEVAGRPIDDLIEAFLYDAVLPDLPGSA